ncbi:MAG: helix-turn-helix transcriptional regulator [Thermoguttaceae bacterium]
MIAPEIVAQIRRLLQEDRLSQRQIARLVGVCRGSVAAIASGRRPDYESRPVEEDLEPSGPPVRCPSCGSKVYMPCVLCGLRNEMVNRTQTPARSQRPLAAVSTDLDLRPEHRLRYEQVREARLAAEAVA